MINLKQLLNIICTEAHTNPTYENPTTPNTQETIRINLNLIREENPQQEKDHKPQKETTPQKQLAKRD